MIAAAAIAALLAAGVDDIAVPGGETDPYVQAPILVEKRASCPLYASEVREDELTQTLAPTTSLSTVPLGADPGDEVVELRAGQQYRGLLCSGAGEFAVLQAERGSLVEVFDAVPVFDQQAVQELLDDTLGEATVKTPERVDASLQLFEQPGDQSTTVGSVEPGDRLTAVSRPYGGTFRSGLAGTSEAFSVIETADGQIGWLTTGAVALLPDPKTAWQGAPTRTVTVGSEVPIYQAVRPIDPTDVEPTTPGEQVATLSEGQKVVVSQETFTRPQGGGCLGLAASAERARRLPESERHLAEQLVVVQIPDEGGEPTGTLGWAPGWLELELPDEPTETATQTAEPGTASEPDPVPTDPEFTSVVERVDAAAGTVSKFAIRKQPQDSAPYLGRIEGDGVQYSASDPIKGENSLLHGDLWRAVSVSVDGEPVVGWVHDDDVVTIPGATMPEEPPAVGDSLTDQAKSKAAEKAAERENKPSLLNPFAVVTSTIALLLAGLAAVGGLLLLAIGWSRAQAKLAGRVSIPSSPLATVLRILPTTGGTLLVSLSAYLAVGAWAFPLAVIGGLVAGLVCLARAASYRGHLVRGGATVPGWHRCGRRRARRSRAARRTRVGMGAGDHPGHGCRRCDPRREL